MTYVTLAAFKEYIGETGASHDGALQRALDAAESWINDYTGRTFALDASDTTREFYPNSDGTLSVPDLVTATSIKSDSAGDKSYSTTFATTDYELLPLDGPPYQTVRIWPTSSKSFAQGRLVQIIGKFGDTVGSAAPVSVQQAELILASRFYHRKDAPFGILQSVDLGQFTRISKEDPDVITLLEPFKVTGAAGWVVV